MDLDDKYTKMACASCSAMTDVKLLSKRQRLCPSKLCCCWTCIGVVRSGIQLQYISYLTCDAV